MRKLIYAINLTLDGCCEHTKVGGDEPTLIYYTKMLQNFDLIVYGRKTYELMIPYWPEVETDPTSSKSEIDYAKQYNAISKVVFSKTLTHVDDKNSRLVATDLVEEIKKLKQQEGKGIMVGGVDVPSQLLEHGLIDEFYIVVKPLIVGEGRRLFDHTKLQETLRLKLIASETLETGAIAYHYGKG